MLTYELDRREDIPLYEYLYRCIREDILSGALSAGEKLPSKRSLAEHLDLSVMTVENAYCQLEAEGYVTARPRRGFFVSAVQGTPEAGEVQRLPPVPEERQYRLDLKQTSVDVRHFPVSAWLKLTRQVLSESGGGLLAPVPHQGLPALRQAIARDLRERKGMAVDPEQIVVGAGAEYLYLLLAQLLGREAVLAVEDPGYPKIRKIYSKWGVPCVPVALDRQGIPPAALERAGARAVHLSPSHHYPTGLVTPIGRRQALLAWAERTDGIIIEDDYDSEFRFTGRPLPTLQSIDPSGRVVYMNTFSQTISPAMRVGFMVLPPRLLERYRQELGFYACTVPALEQHVLARFLEGGSYGRHIARMRKTYRTLRGTVLEAFRTLEGAEIAEEGAGLHFLLRLHTDQPDRVLRQRAEALGVRLSFLSEFAAVDNRVYQHQVIVNYGSLTPETLPEAVSLLRRVLTPGT